MVIDLRLESENSWESESLANFEIKDLIELKLSNQLVNGGLPIFFGCLGQDQLARVAILRP
ncbi:MAG: hypothetical protein ACR2QW_02025, partial [bacterium]